MTIRRAIRPLGSGKICPYEENQVLFESSTPGVYNFEVKSTIDCEVEICGGGGGGFQTSSIKSTRYYGGAAAAFKGVIRLKKDIYQLVVGKAGQSGRQNSSACTSGTDSLIGSLLTAGAGKAYLEGANGGVLTLNVTPLSSSISSNGAASSSISLLENGYGKGGYSSNIQPTCGYIKIVYKG